MAAAFALLLAVAGQSAVAGASRQARESDSKPATPTVTPANLSAGTWGGRGIALTISPDGDARVELDCARGTIPPPLAVRSDGRFEWNGTFGREGPGPIRQGRSQSGRPVRFRGEVRGDTMTLSVEPADSGNDSGADSLGSFTLTRGVTPRIRKCS